MNKNQSINQFSITISISIIFQRMKLEALKYTLHQAPKLTVRTLERQFADVVSKESKKSDFKYFLWSSQPMEFADHSTALLHAAQAQQSQRDLFPECPRQHQRAASSSHASSPRSVAKPEDIAEAMNHHDLPNASFYLQRSMQFPKWAKDDSRKPKLSSMTWNISLW